MNWVFHDAPTGHRVAGWRHGVNEPALGPPEDDLRDPLAVTALGQDAELHGRAVCGGVEDSLRQLAGDPHESREQIVSELPDLTLEHASVLQADPELMLQLSLSLELGVIDGYLGAQVVDWKTINPELRKLSSREVQLDGGRVIFEGPGPVPYPIGDAWLIVQLYRVAR